MISVRTFKLLRKLWVTFKVTMGLSSMVAMIWAVQALVSNSQHKHGQEGTAEPSIFPGLKDQGGEEAAIASVRPTGDRQRSAEAAAVLAQLTLGPNSTAATNAASAAAMNQATMFAASRPPAVDASSTIPESKSNAAVAQSIKPTAVADKRGTFDQEIEQAVSIQPLESGAGEVKQVRSILDRYRKSAGWWERMCLVRSPGRLASLAHNYYEEQRQSDPVLDKLVGATRFDIGDESFIQLAFLSSGRWSNTVRVNFLLSASGDPQIDWESFVAYGEETWAIFVSGRIEKPTLLRGYASVDDYYNYEFTDREKFISIRLRSPDGAQTLTGFTERESRDGQLLAKITGQINSMLLDGPLPVNSGGPTVPATLRIAYPPHPQSDRCVRIHAVIADRWVLTDAEEAKLDSK